MAKKQKPADAAKDKAAKQKKMAVVLIVLLVLAMVYAFMTVQGLNGGPPSSKPQAAPTSAASNPATTPTTTPLPSPTPVAPTLAGVPVAAVDPAAAAVVPGATAIGATQLITAVSPPADAGQLQSFSRFESKDPFANGLASKPASSGSTGGGSGTSSSGGSSGSKPASPPVVPPAPPVPPPSSAVISVNGVSESVTSGASFPVANPDSSSNGLFQLVSLTAKTATISVVGGSYASGSHTLALKVNKAVTLVNTADGTRYTLQLYPQGTVAPAAPAGGSTGTPSSGTSTTPAAPTTGG